MKEPVLTVMAAGLGSRYGGIKQMDSIGSNGEWIIDFSLYDAYKAGFKEVVFIIREEMLDDFRETIGTRVGENLKIGYALQKLEDIPKPYEIPINRTKPWGTAHAVYSAREFIKNRPTMVINADDYYGPKAFEKLYSHLITGNKDYAMVAYLLENTVSDVGYVSRGICQVTNDDYIQEITERTRIEKHGEFIEFSEDKGISWTSLPSDTLVSLNCWAFSKNFIDNLEDDFPKFLADLTEQNNSELEYFLPTMVERLMENGKAKVKAIKSSDSWYGVTYKEDKERVSKAINKMKDQGIYPENLWY